MIANPNLIRPDEVNPNTGRMIRRKRPVMPSALAPPAGSTPDISTAFGSDGRLNPQGLLSYLSASQREAKGANESRYQQALNTTRNAYSRAAGELTGIGTSDLDDIERRRKERRAETQARYTALGLGGSTLVDNMNRGIDEDADRSALRVRESVGDRRAGLFEREGAGVSGLMERRYDEYPDTGLYVRLLQEQAKSDEETRRRNEERRRREQPQNITLGPGQEYLLPYLLASSREF